MEVELPARRRTICTVGCPTCGGLHHSNIEGHYARSRKLFITREFSSSGSQPQVRQPAVRSA